MWTDLELLDLSSNHLSGTLPVSIGLWTNLLFFQVSGNRLHGSLDDLLSASLPLYEPTAQQQQQQSLSLWFPSLHYFDVSNNLIAGLLPLALARWNAMTSFRFPQQLIDRNDSVGSGRPIVFFYSFGEFQKARVDAICTTGNTTYITSDCDRG
jgi:hypothetical protein